MLKIESYQNGVEPERPHRSRRSESGTKNFAENRHRMLSETRSIHFPKHTFLKKINGYLYTDQRTSTY